MSTSALCAHRHPDGSFCKRWASKDSRLCYRHQPKDEYADENKHDAVHPLARLATLADIFDVVRETLNAVRLGQISPGQAYATGYMVDHWLRIYDKMTFHEREKALESQMLPEALEEVVQAQRERERERTHNGPPLEGKELDEAVLASVIAPFKLGPKPPIDGGGT